MKFLIVGDVVGYSGTEMIKNNLKRIINEEKIDFCIVNGENATGGRGLKEKEMKIIFNSGANVITMGNHIYYRKEAKELYVNVPNLLIPANITNMPGKGYVVIEKNNKKIAVINLIGRVGMGEISNEFITNPFEEASKILEELKKHSPDLIFVDFHAEATAEKIAMAYYLEDKVTCVYGTHTHVQTADEQIMDGKVAYITDVGMTGPKGSVLGLKKEIAIQRFVTGEKIKYECSDNEANMCYIIVETNEDDVPIVITRHCI